MSEALEASLAEEQRYRAVRELPVAGAGAVEALLAHLSDGSWRVRKAAVEKLISVAPIESVLPALLDALGLGDDAQARNAAAEALARIGRPALGPVAARLASGDADVRKFAADILGEIGHADGVEALAQALDDPDRNVRASAAEGLGKLGGPRAAVALERALRLEEPLLRVSVLEGLWRIGATPRVEVLAPLADNRFLRRPVYRLLGRQGGARALELLLAGLGDPGRTTREAALAALSEQARRGDGFFWGRWVVALRTAPLGVEAMVVAAREVLRSGDPAAVEGALLVLGALGDVASVPELAERGGAERLREAARVALTAIGPAGHAHLLAVIPDLPAASLELVGEVLGADPGGVLTARALESLEGASPELAASLFELLGRFAGPEHAAALLLRVEDPRVGELATRALQLLARRAGKALLERARALWREQPTPSTCLLLGEVGEAEDLDLLRSALGESDPELRIAAARVLSARGVRGSIDALRSGLTDESADVRAACVRALARLRAPGLEASLRTALVDPSPRVASAAAEVAGREGLREVAPLLVGLVERGPGAVALAGLEALERLSELEPGLLRRASAHAHPEVCRVAMELAGARAGGLELVAERLRHERWEVRRAAARVASRLGERSQLPALRERLAQEEDPLVLEAVHHAIAAIEAIARS